MGNCIATTNESDGATAAKSATALRSTHRSPSQETPFPTDPSPPRPPVVGERIPSTNTSSSASPPNDERRTTTARRLSDKRLSFDRLSASQNGTKRSSMLSSFEAPSMSSGKRSSLQSTLSGSHRRSGTFVSTVDAMWSSQILSFDHASGIAAETHANLQSQPITSSFETGSPSRTSPSTTARLAFSTTDHDAPASATRSPSHRPLVPMPPSDQRAPCESDLSSSSPAVRNVLAGRPPEQERAGAESDTDADEDTSLRLVKSGEEIEFAAPR